MKVTNKMIHKDIRLIGSILRLFTRGTTKESFCRQYEKTRQDFEKCKPKKAAMERIYLKRADGSDMRTVILKPQKKVAGVPLVLWLHGGGYVLGYPENDFSIMEQLMDAADCIMVSPDYTLGVSAPYPAALLDAYQALLWAKEHAEELGANPDQIFVGGESAGGGLAAALAIYARDKGEVQVAFQMPLYPMLDDRGITESARDNDAPMWDSNSNTIAWKMYLGELYGTDNVPPYAAPSRLTDFSGLPPAYSYVGSIEPFYDETRIYFEELKKAGVPCHLDIYPGGFHGFDTIGAKKPIGREAHAKLADAFQNAAAHYFAKNT